MTRKWSNLNLPGALHFVTGNFADRLPVFTEPACCRAFIEVLAELNQSWPSKLIAYVLMPDHLHLIANPRDGRIKEFTGALKSLSAKRIIEVERRFSFESEDSGRQVWQESFKAMPLWSLWMIYQKINYIHANPLKAGLVKAAKEYEWSSFRAFYLGEQKPLPIDQEWWWTDDPEKLSKAMKAIASKSRAKRGSGLK